MVKKMTVLVLAVLQILCLCACGSKGTPTPTTTAPTEGTTAPITTTTEPVPTTTEQIPATTVPEIYDHTSTDVYQQINWFDKIQTAKMEGVLEGGEYFYIPTTEDLYKVMQGCCTDGQYMYAILEKKNQDVDGETRSLCRVFKVDLDSWEVVAISEPLKLDHANGATFNTKTNEILVTHYNYLPNTLSVVDPETLTITRTVELDYELRGIAYNEEKDQYAVVVKNSCDIVIYDADFVEQAYYECEDPGLGKQCVSWDGEYLYLSYTGALKSKTAGSEIICCYDWSGNFCGVFRLNVYIELEGSFHVNGETYISFYNNGGKFYRLNLDGIELLEPQN